VTARGGARRFAAGIAAALRDALGDTHRAVKTVMKWTGANERTVKNWFSGITGPSGEHLIELVSQSDAVLEAFLGIAGRRDILDSKRMIDAHGRLAEMLAMVDQLRVDRLEGSSADPAQRMDPAPAERRYDPVNDPGAGPVNDPVKGSDGKFSERQRWFMDQLAQGKSVKATDLRRRWAVSEKTAKRDIAALKNRGLIEFSGSFKTGAYRLVRYPQRP
jgi:hypothetical protein